MTLQVKFTDSARDHFLDVLGEIALEDLNAAQKFQKRVEDSLRRLELFPSSGRIIPEFPELDYREVIVPPYRFFYTVKEDAVWVVALWHGAQLPAHP